MQVCSTIKCKDEEREKQITTFGEMGGRGGNAIAMTTANDPNNPNRCWMKSKLENCHPAVNQLTGTLMHYDCRDNHNCGGSYVQIKECSIHTQVLKRTGKYA